MPEKNELSRGEVAAMLKVHPRTVTRMAQREELTQKSNGTYEREEVEQLAEAMDVANRESHESQALRAMTEAHLQATQHAERLVSLLEKPIQNALATVTKINENLVARLAASDAAQLEAWKLVGELHLAKEERIAIRVESEAKAETMRMAGRQLEQAVPLLIAKAGGKDAVAKFAANLTEEEKAQLALLYWAFDEGEKRDSFGAVLKTIGAAIPPSPEAEEVPS